MTTQLLNLYKECTLNITSFESEKESKSYDAAKFKLNDSSIIFRKAKITPKKVGQFVTFWKRSKEGITVPFHTSDIFDFYVINVQYQDLFGQFVFPKSILEEKGIITTSNKEGKRGFRVYPVWDIPKSKQAIQTQKWQLDYFYELNDFTEIETVKKLYRKIN